MRKASPNEVIDAFVQSTSAGLADWQVIDASLSDLRLRRRVASDAFLALAVAWETFLSQWLIAAVNRDSSTAVRYLTQRLQDHATGELRVPQTHVSATLITKNHFTLALVRQLLDPHDNNVVLREHKRSQGLRGPLAGGQLRTAVVHHHLLPVQACPSHKTRPKRTGASVGVCPAAGQRRTPKVNGAAFASSYHQSPTECRRLAPLPAVDHERDAPTRPLPHRTRGNGPVAQGPVVVLSRRPAE